MPTKIRVRRDHPSALSWTLALAVTMLAVYLITLSAPAVKEDAAETVAQEERVAREVVLEGVEMCFADLGCWPDAIPAHVAASELAQRGAAGVVYQDSVGYHVLGAAYEFRTDAERIARQIGEREGMDTGVLSLSAASVSLRITAPERDILAIIDADRALSTLLKQIASMALQVDRGELTAASARTLAAVSQSELESARKSLAAIAGASDEPICAGLLAQLQTLHRALDAVSHGCESGAALSGRLRSCHVAGLLERIQFLNELSGAH